MQNFYYFFFLLTGLFLALALFVNFLRKYAGPGDGGHNEGSDNDSSGGGGSDGGNGH